MTRRMKWSPMQWCSLCRAHPRHLALFVSTLLLSGPIAAASAQPISNAVREAHPAQLEATAQEVRVLEPGKPLERALAGGETHAYRLTLAAGHYLAAVVEQRGIDVVVVMFGPDGKQLAEIDSPNGTQGPEPVFLITEAAGDYKLEVRSLEKDSQPGRYAVKIAELRAATSSDRSRLAARQAFAEGEQLRQQGTAESLRKAIEKYQEALLPSREADDRQTEADAITSLGRVYSALGEPQKALPYFNQALPLLRAIADRSGEATTLNNLGLAYARSGNQQKALEHYQQALSIHRALGDRAEEAVTVNNIGLVYDDLGEEQKALEYYQQALALRRAVRNREGEAAALTNIGGAYADLGENRKALEYFQQALSLWREVKGLRGEAIALNNIGAAYGRLGEPQKALDYFTQSLPLRRRAGDRVGEAVALNNIGMIYEEFGEPQKALDYLQQALPLARGSSRFVEGNTLNNFGKVYSALGQNQQAMNSFNQAVSLLRAVGNRTWEANALRSLGRLYADLGEQQQALDHYHQALQLARAVGSRDGESSILNLIGQVYATSGNQQQALEHYHQALQLAREVGDRNGEAAVLYGIARVMGDRGDFSAARANLEAVLRQVESVRVSIISRDLRSSFFASNQRYYGFYIDLLMRLHKEQPAAGYDRLALQASERARARTLLETLTEAQADIRQGVDAALLERERSLQQLLNGKAERLTRLLGGKATEAQKAAAGKELESLIAQYQEVQAQIRQSSPRYAALTQPQPLSAQEIQQQALDADTLLLEYALGEERSFVWAVTPTSITSYDLPRRAEIEAAAKRVYELMTKSNERASMGQVALAATELSRMLLGPVASQLGRKRLLIVADGALQYVPFAALPIPATGGLGDRKTGRRGDGATGRGISDRPVPPSPRRPVALTPLIAEHEIVSLPSASVLAVLRRELAGRQPAAKEVAVLADPVFDRRDERLALKDRTGSGSDRPYLKELERSASESGGFGFARLRFTRQEAEQIASLAPVEKSLKAVDFLASRATATSGELGQYRIVHVATHGLLNSQHPELSGLVLSLLDERGGPQDGFLRAHEVYNLKLPAELVVLSGCQTALGKEIKGEGLVSLTRGFMYAGAARVVVSLWKVSDEATAELMKRFYQGMLRDRLRPASALRAAQVALSKERRWATPYYWAAFVLQGEWK